jgi:hypothetical protein
MSRFQSSGTGRSPGDGSFTALNGLGKIADGFEDRVAVGPDRIGVIG